MSVNTTKKKYNLLNAVRIIASFFIVAIHIKFPGVYGSVVVNVARFAVPFFFMTSGFFSYYENSPSVLKKVDKKIKHITVIFLGASALYCAYGLMGGISYLKNLFSLTSLAELFIFNQPKVSEHLWFLPALIYVYIIFRFFEKFKITKKMYVLIPVLFLAGVVIREAFFYMDYALPIMKKAYLCRNFLFVGLPFFLLGHYIRANEEKLKAKFSNTALIAAVVLGTAEAVAVGIWHIQKSVYFGTFAAVFALFIFVIKNEESLRMPRLASMGEKYSLYIYILHIIINNSIKKLGDFIPLIKSVYEVLSPVMPIIIFALTLIASAVYVVVKTKIKSTINQKKSLKLKS